MIDPAAPRRTGGAALPIKVVHFSAASSAGQAIRLVRALDAHTDVRARLVQLRPHPLFEHDLIHDEDPEAARSLAEEADVIHLHNFLDLDSRGFPPLDFRDLYRRGKRVVRQFHSVPALVARKMGKAARQIVEDPLPQLVCAAHQERFYPRARVMPNLIPQDDPDHLPVPGAPRWDIAYSPTTPRAAWIRRWDTKGYPETLLLLARMRLLHGARVKVIRKAPLREALGMKARARIIIDELVTGSYHQASLEGLSLGRPVVNHLDGRTDRVLRVISGADHSPFVEARLEDAPGVLAHLLRHPEEADEVGAEGRRWLLRHWRDRDIAERFAQTYRDLMEDPSRVCRQPELALEGRAGAFFALTLPELTYRARRRRCAPVRNLLFPPR